MGLSSSVTARARPGSARDASAGDGHLQHASLLKPSALTWAGLVVVLVAVGIFLMHETRDTTLLFDEWTWALDRRGNDVATFLEPHNSHLSAVPIALYRLLFATAGLNDYTPYRLVVIGAHFTCVVLVFVYASRRIGGFLGLLGAALILFLGPAAENIIWPFQTAWLISLGAGVGALLMLDRADRVGDLAASGLLALSLASSGIGVPIALGLLVDVLWGRRRWRDAWIVAIPLAAYALWWVGYQDPNWVRDARAYGIDDPVISGVLRTPEFVAEAAAAAMSALVGLGGDRGLDNTGPGTFLQWGPALLIGGVAALVWRPVRAGRVAPRIVALLTIVVSFWVLAAVTRGFVSAPYTSRYLYVGGLFIVLLAVELARGVRVSRRAGLLLAAVVAAAVVSNLGAFRNHAGYVRIQAQLTETQLGALDIARPIVKPGFKVEPSPYLGITAAPYFALEDAEGTPAATPAELTGEHENVRSAVDSVLIRAHELALREATVDLGSETRPEVDSVAGGSVTPRRACFTFRPEASTTGSDTSELRATIGPGGVVVKSTRGPATVGVRRFANEFQALGSVAAETSAALRIRPDRANLPWHLRIAAAEPVRVCGLG